MTIDFIARGLAARALRKANRPKIAVGIIGQSNERGNVLTSDQAAWPQCFASLRNPCEQAPIGPAVTINGGWWHYAYDALYDWGYDVHLVNGAIGSASFLTQVPNYIQTRQSNARYANKRASVGPGDRGDAGDVISVGGRIFRAQSGGMNRFALNAGPQRDSNGNATYVDYITGLNSGGTTAATATDFTLAAIGGTVIDGAITWVRENEAFYVNTLNGVLTDAQSSHTGYGFDPLGILQRLHEEMQRVRGVSRKIIYIANGQTDLGTSATVYASCLQSIAAFFLRRGYEVMIGLTMHSPGASLSSVANYNSLSTGVANSIATLLAAYPGKVWAGANLYTAMGTTGPMSGANFTGAVASNVLTVSAVSAGGSGLAVGQRVCKADGTVIGTISAPGTGSGGTGTYTLTGGVDTASQTMRSVGAFLQTVDGVHINGAGAVGPDVAGVSCAGKYVADALKLVLPRP